MTDTNEILDNLLKKGRNWALFSKGLTKQLCNKEASLLVFLIRERPLMTSHV